MILLLQDPMAGMPAGMQWGLGAMLLAVLYFAVNTIKQVTKENADRAQKAQENCDTHNKEVVCEFSKTVLSMNESHQTLVAEMRLASDKREERLHDLVRELRTPQKP